MKFYRLSLHSNVAGHGGYSFHTSKAEAERERRADLVHVDEVKITVIEIKPTRAGILEALNTYASHNNNG